MVAGREGEGGGRRGDGAGEDDVGDKGGKVVAGVRRQTAARNCDELRGGRGGPRRGLLRGAEKACQRGAQDAVCKAQTDEGMP